MTQFKLILSNPDFASELTDNTAAAVNALRDSMAEWTPTPETTGHVVVLFKPDGTSTDKLNTYEQLCNFIALVNKGWNHLAFMAGQADGSQSPPLNPWGLMRDNAGGQLDATAMGSGCVSIVAVEDHYEIKIRMFHGSVPRTSIVNVAFRLANLSEWCVKYDNKIRLTGASKLKWKTFNEISVQIAPGIKFPERREPVQDAEGEPRPRSRRAQQRERLANFYGGEHDEEDLDDEQ